MQFPWASNAGCGGIVVDYAAEVVGRRSLGLSASSNYQHHDYEGSYCPRKSLVLHEKPPNLRFVPLFPEAPRAFGDVRARAGELQLKNCASATSHSSSAYTIERLEGNRQTARSRIAAISRHAVECSGLPW